MEEIVYDRFDNFIEKHEIEKELYKCFSQLVNIDPNNTVALLKINNLILAIATLQNEYDKISIWNVCSTSLGKISTRYGASMSPVQYLLNDIITKADKPLVLYVDFNNPYWDRAVGLYVKLGFVLDTTIISPLANLVPMKYVGVVDESMKDILKRMRKWYFRDYEYKTFKFDPSISDFGKFMMEKQSEFGGHFVLEQIGVDEYIIKETSNLVSGNLIEIKINATAMCSRYNSPMAFHTHPKIATTNNNLLFNPPSSQDVENLFNCNILLREYVFATKGIFAISIAPKAYLEMCRNHVWKETVKQESLKLYQDGIDAMIVLDQAFLYQYQSNISVIENVQIQEFISYVFTIKVDDIQIFDIKYWPYGSVIIDTLIYPKNCYPSRIISTPNKLPFALTDDQKALIDRFNTGALNRAINTVECERVDPIPADVNNPGETFKRCYPYSFVNIGEIVNLLTDKWAQKDRVFEMIESGATITDIIWFIQNEMKVD